MTRTQAQKDGLVLLCLGVLAFLLIGFGTIFIQKSTMLDVRIAHASARALIQGADPYKVDDLVRVFNAAGGPGRSRPRDFAMLDFDSRYIYLPTVFAITGPIAALPFPVFLAIWMTLVVGTFLLATALVWDIAQKYSPVLTGGLLGFYLANSGTVISAANAGSLSVGLCIISVWCFLVERFEIGGVLCLAASLAIKPHDSGLVWLFLIIFGGTARKRAIQSLLVYIGLAIPMFAWVSKAAPNWRHELQANLFLLSSHGAVSDPGPSTVFQRGALMVTNLQSAISLIWDKPDFYNPASYGICLLIFAGLSVPAIRWRSAGGKRWLAIASVAALTALPVYHRLYDAKLLLLTIPACAILWQRGGKTARFSLLVTASALIVTSDILWAFYVLFAGRQSLPEGISKQLLVASIALPIPATLFIVSVFYLWAFARVDVPESALVGRRH